MERGDHIVYVVDDDAGVREAVADLLLSSGFRVAAFGSAAEYRAAPKRDVPTCLILDIRLPDANGLDLQLQLAACEASGSDCPPIVFISAHGDVASSVRAMKAGAEDFLPKPFAEASLLRAVEAALIRHNEARQTAALLGRLRGRYGSLTQRERDTLPLIVSGFLNKQAAAKLGISVVTLQIHRSHIMRKMGARSLADLVRMASWLAIPTEPAPGRDGDDSIPSLDLRQARSRRGETSPSAR